MRILIIILIACMLGCTNEMNYPQSFPIVTTGYVTNISGDGAEFSATIASRGNGDPIIQHGFVWSPFKNPTLNSSRFILAGNPDDNFSVVLTQGLIKAKLFVRAFVQTSKTTVYGNEINFKSQGSRPPTIESFTPAEGLDGTEVTITLSSYLPDANTQIILPGNVQCEILSLADNLIKVKVPPSTLIGKFQFELHTSVNTTASRGRFNILGPSITSIPKTTAIVGEHLLLTGVYFDKATKIEIKFLPEDDVKVSVVSTVLSPTEIDIQIPNRPGKIGRFQIESTNGKFTKVSILGKSFSITN